MKKLGYLLLIFSFCYVFLYCRRLQEDVRHLGVYILSSDVEELLFQNDISANVLNRGPHLIVASTDDTSPHILKDTLFYEFLKLGGTYKVKNAANGLTVYVGSTTIPIWFQ